MSRRTAFREDNDKQDAGIDSINKQMCSECGCEYNPAAAPATWNVETMGTVPTFSPSPASHQWS